MSRIYRNAGNGELSSSVGWLWLVITFALILVLAGCGSSGTAGKDTSGEKPYAGQTGGAAKTEQAEQTSGDQGDLGTPVLGDSGAPVVMVEYSDYQ